METCVSSESKEKYLSGEATEYATTRAAALTAALAAGVCLCFAAYSLVTRSCCCQAVPFSVNLILCTG